MSKIEKRATFGTKLGILAATAGSAIGLGNIWRFPTQAAQDGGAVFIFIYIACVLFFGVPVILAEFILGRAGKANNKKVYEHLRPGTPFRYFGYLSILTPFIIVSFYMVIAGWTIEYFWLSLKGALNPGSDSKEIFTLFSQDTSRQILWLCLFSGITGGIIAFGIKKGIELANKLMMPLLFLVLLILCVRALTLEGASEGVRFLFSPNFALLKESGGKIFADALGQSFFSLSLGAGVLTTYASYFKRDVPLVKTAGKIALLDTGVALLAGIIIFPAAFALAGNPEATIAALKTSGPGLVFITMPQLLQSLPGTQIWCVLFFLLLILASLTSSISLFEVVASFGCEEIKFRGKNIPRYLVAAGITISTALIGVICIFSLQSNSSLQTSGMPLFDLLDYLSAKIFMPCCGIATALFVSCFLDKKILTAELTCDGELPLRFFKTYRFILRYIATSGILLIMVYGLI